MRSNTRKLPLTFALLAGVALTLAACSGTSMPTDDATMDGVATADAASTADATGAPASEAADSSAAAVPAPQTLPDALENADGLQTVAEALKVTGLAATTFNGQASYTLLAPEDDAFVSLGSARKALFAAGDHSELAVLIKNHLLPGRICSPLPERAAAPRPLLPSS
ncbi:MAG: fasciclin domain-containing protein [Novosphingobium sp.]